MSRPITLNGHKLLLRNIDRDEKSGIGRQDFALKNVKKKVKSSNMVSVENELLFKLVVRNFKEFNAKPPPGIDFPIRRIEGKKGGKSCRQRLLEEWAARVSALGISTRSPEQIQEKVRKAIDRCRRSIALESENVNGLVGNDSMVKLPYYLKPLKQMLLTGEEEEEEEEEECDLRLEPNEEDNDSHFDNMNITKEPTEPSDSSVFTVTSIFNVPCTTSSFDVTSSTADSAPRTQTSSAPNEVHVSTISPFLGSHSSISPTAKKINSETEVDAESELRLSMMEAERKAAEMKKAYYAKKIELVDAQLQLTLLQIQQQRQRIAHADARNMKL